MRRSGKPDRRPCFTVPSPKSLPYDWRRLFHLEWSLHAGNLLFDMLWLPAYYELKREAKFVRSELSLCGFRGRSVSQMLHHFLDLLVPVPLTNQPKDHRLRIDMPPAQVRFHHKSSKIAQRPISLRPTDTRLMAFEAVSLVGGFVLPLGGLRYSFSW